MKDRLRGHLATTVAKKVDAYGLVVWDDPAGEYGREVVEAIVPPDAEFQAFDGSWYELRRRIEGSLGGDHPPRLLIYVSARAPENDPLLEVRSSGTAFTIRLATLVQQALAGQLTEGRLREIGRKARTLSEAEAALDGDGFADPRLVAALGSSDTRKMVIAVFTGERDAQIEQSGAWPEVIQLLQGAMGGNFKGDGEKLRVAGFKHAILAELTASLGGLPAELAPSWEPPTQEQCHSATEILESWRNDRDRAASYVRRAVEVDGQLALNSYVPWKSALIDLDSLPSIEALALREGIRRLADQDFGGAADLARERLAHSLWAGAVATDDLHVPQWGARWEVLAAVADLRAALTKEELPAGDAARIADWYSSSGWAVDRAHRRLETRSSDLSLEGELEGEISEARSRYEQWLDRLVERFIASLAAAGMDSHKLMLQGHIHARLLAEVKQLTAYIWVDALRYELGLELADRLRPVCSSVEVRPAVAGIPSITPVGMANLCPGAEGGLALDIERGKLTVRIGDIEVKDAATRVELVRVAHGPIEDLLLSRLLSQGEKKLSEATTGKALVLVRSQEIDAAGESGMLATSWQGFEDTVQQLVRAAARLAQAGVRRVVISADHGFVALSRPLGQDRRVEAPTGGKGELHARAWVGRGGIDTSATVRVPLSSFGERGDLDLLCPAHLAVFRGSWGGQFFHGGLSPQELVIPVVVAELRMPVKPETRKIDIDVSGGRLTSGAFSATLSFQPTLFSGEPAVRLLVRKHGEAAAVARVFRGEGYDPDADVVRLRNTSTSLTFRLISNLKRDDEVEIVVLDATTDQKLGSAVARALLPIVVEDQLQ